MVTAGREIFLLCFVAAVLTFLIAGLLLICASSTSITGSVHRIPSETGLLISSGFANYAGLSDTRHSGDTKNDEAPK
jgi:hypothetical protein